MHDLQQILVGFLFGLILSLIYYKLNSISLIIIFIIIYFNILIYLIINKIDYYIQNEPIPEWVDKSLYEILEKKKNINYIYKCFYLIMGYFINNPVIFCSWKEIENNLDIIINKIKLKNIKIDIVIGIKTGGAILSKYIANKLNIPYDFIKISHDKNKCIKSSYEEINFHLSKNIKNYDMIICEDIKIDIENKNILLVDELIFTGKTINFISNYLINNKKANNINVACINNIYNKDNNIISSTESNYNYLY